MALYQATELNSRQSLERDLQLVLTAVNTFRGESYATVDQPRCFCRSCQMKEAASVETDGQVAVVRLEIMHLGNLNLPKKKRVFKHHTRSASSSPAEAQLSQQSELQTTESRREVFFNVLNSKNEMRVRDCLRIKIHHLIQFLEDIKLEI